MDSAPVEFPLCRLTPLLRRTIGTNKPRRMGLTPCDQNRNVCLFRGGCRPVWQPDTTKISVESKGAANRFLSNRVRPMVASGRDFFNSIGKALLIQRPSPVPLPAFADKKKNQKIRLTACPSTIGAEPMNSLWITFHNPLEELRKIGQVKLLRRRAGCFRNRPRGPLVGKGICMRSELPLRHRASCERIPAGFSA